MLQPGMLKATEGPACPPRSREKPCLDPDAAGISSKARLHKVDLHQITSRVSQAPAHPPQTRLDFLGSEPLGDSDHTYSL